MGASQRLVAAQPPLTLPCHLLLDTAPLLGFTHFPLLPGRTGIEGCALPSEAAWFPLGGPIPLPVSGQPSIRPGDLHWL